MAERIFEGQSFGAYGDVYRWLRENYDYIYEWRAKTKPSWNTIASVIDQRGVKSKKGAPPVGRLVRRIWVRVQRDIEIEEERRLEQEAAEKAARYARLGGVDPPKRRSSDFPKDWRPEEAGPSIDVSRDGRVEGSRDLVPVAEGVPPTNLSNAEMGRRSMRLVVERLRNNSGLAKPRF